MNFDELKETWQIYDQKLTAARMINDKLIKSMIRDKSGSTLAKMRRNSLLTILLMAVIIWFCIMSIIYNAFDYEYKLQFLPLVIYVIVAIIFIVYLVKEYLNSKVDLYKDNLKQALLKVIVLHEKFMSVNLKLGLVFLPAGFLYLVSASFRVAQKHGVMHALLFLAGGVIVNALAIIIAKKSGAFKDHHGIKLKAQLNELEEFDNLQN